MITFLVVSGAFFIAHGHNALRIRVCTKVMVHTTQGGLLITKKRNKHGTVATLIIR
jgi:hypothetical protein